MRITRRSLGVAMAVGFLGLLLWAHAAPAGEAPQMQDTLNTVVKRGELIVGTFDFFPPWGFRDAQNNIVGLDVDIANDLAKEMKVKLTLVPVPTAPQTIIFTEPYVSDGFGVIFRKEAKIMDWPDLNGKKVAVTTGSTGEILVSQK